MNKTRIIVGLVVLVFIAIIIFLLLSPAKSPSNNSSTVASSTPTLGGSLYEGVSQNPAQNMPETNPLSSENINPFQKAPKNPFE